MLQLLRLPVDNACAMLRVLVMLDSKPTRISEQGIITLSNFLSKYLIDVLHVSLFCSSSSSLFDIYFQHVCLILKEQILNCTCYSVLPFLVICSDCVIVGSWNPWELSFETWLSSCLRVLGCKNMHWHVKYKPCYLPPSRKAP